MKSIYPFFVTLLSFLLVDYNKQNQPLLALNSKQNNKVEIVILGTVQDAGSPQIGCTKECCRKLFKQPDKNRRVVSLGLIDYNNQSHYLFEATPDIATQLKDLKNKLSLSAKELPNAIFLSHAHIGHYAGLMYLGKEAADANMLSVYAMPRMKTFLENNGPWSQLIQRKNISITPLQNEVTIRLTNNISVVPFLVPHRDEFSETVGYKIIGPNKKALFIPDIDKWQKWDKDISEEIKKVDYAFVDATFYDGKEINNRTISEIPHPFIIESMSLFSKLSLTEKRKIVFIHFNHTNPLLNKNSQEAKEVLNNGFRIAKIHDSFPL